MRIITQTEQ